MAAADLLADASDLRLDEVAGRPVSLAAADLEEEVLRGPGVDDPRNREDPDAEAEDDRDLHQAVPATGEHPSQALPDEVPEDQGDGDVDDDDAERTEVQPGVREHGHGDAGHDQPDREQRGDFGRIVVVQGYHREQPACEAVPILAAHSTSRVSLFI